jgi:hypothetical protein
LEHIMKIIIRPAMEPQHEIDVTQRLVAAIAEELWRVSGGNDRLNWLEAEAHLQRIVGDARAEASVTASRRFKTLADSMELVHPEAGRTRDRSRGRAAGRTRAAEAGRRRGRRPIGREAASAA